MILLDDAFAVTRLIRLGVSYREAIWMPVRVVGRLLDEERRRSKRISSAAKKGKAMGVVNLMDID